MAAEARVKASIEVPVHQVHHFRGEAPTPSARRAATLRQLRAFFQSLPARPFPVLAALGEHVWADNHDQRFSAGLDTILAGPQAASRNTTS
jgi:hypothetical protein